MEITPIGIYHTSQVFKYDAGRQTDEHSASGYIELFPGHNFEQALIGLDMFSHIWVLFQFHQNKDWKPMTLPPRGSEQKVGVFATRSPYRPNGIGMSATLLTRIEGRKIYLESSDLLDGTPILDLKPYLNFADSFPEASLGWIQDQKFEISFSETAQKQLAFLKDQGLLQIFSFLKHQLQYQPTDSRRKRVQKVSENHFVIAYRTWRAAFVLNEFEVLITEVFSGYPVLELSAPEDTYQDKNLHRTFLQAFPETLEKMSTSS